MVAPALCSRGGSVSDDLSSVTPSKAVELHQESMKDDAAEWTRTSHKSHLRAFVEWCREEGGIDDMNELRGRGPYEFRIWRRNGGYSQGMSKCPSSRSAHDVRNARVTKYRNDGVPGGGVSDRLDASEQVLDKHYDRSSKREKADRRWRIIHE